ncbi:MAG: 4-hydroxy-3-methylbut-2-enyl diphosphate reductase [candidate division WOR-3 bacterium]|nr:4-hydroxy-3-methylbut-2-enyl diphosphate reductase [candidate division WOR-3 bacterium]
MKIYRARHGGFCFGVKRAIKMALEAANKAENVYSLGPLIHNSLAVEDLKKRGIRPVDKIDGTDKNSVIIIRSHGVAPDVLKKINSKHYGIIDATCPRVRRAQRYVQKLIDEGYYVVIVGEKDHPEVKGLLGYAGRHATIYKERHKINKKKIGVVPQTTLTQEKLNDAVADLMSDVIEMKIYNTICRETAVRINEATKLATRSDVMIVVGGKNSANTTRLYHVCKKLRRSHHIESASEVKRSWFKGAKSVGITAGASTPKQQVDEVVRKIRRIYPKK